MSLRCRAGALQLPSRWRSHHPGGDSLDAASPTEGSAPWKSHGGAGCGSEERAIAEVVRLPSQARAEAWSRGGPGAGLASLVIRGPCPWSRHAVLRSELGVQSTSNRLSPPTATPLCSSSTVGLAPSLRVSPRDSWPASRAVPRSVCRWSVGRVFGCLRSRQPAEGLAGSASEVCSAGSSSAAASHEPSLRSLASPSAQIFSFLVITALPLSVKNTLRLLFASKPKPEMCLQVHYFEMNILRGWDAWNFWAN